MSRTSECEEWTGRRDWAGYGAVRYDGRRTHAHRAAWLRARGPIPEGMVVMHICDNRACVKIEHLKLGTQADNIRDMNLKGRARPCRGEKHGCAKLTMEQVAEIRCLYATGRETYITLARRFGVARTTIGAVVRGEHWK